MKSKRRKRKKQKYASNNTSSDESYESEYGTPMKRNKKKITSNSSVSSLSRRSTGGSSQKKVKDISGKALVHSATKSVASISTKASKGGSVKSRKSSSSSSGKKKKKSSPQQEFISDDDDDDDDDDNDGDDNQTQPTITTLTSSTANFKKSKKKRKQKSVLPPTKEQYAWVVGMSETASRAAISCGMRVKVRFTKPKLKWYGGVVTQVSSTGSKIRILYDDGTKEISDFPDNEIIVDECDNGRHSVDATEFQPKELLSTSIPLSVPTKKIVRTPSSNVGSTSVGSSNDQKGDLHSHDDKGIVETPSNDIVDLPSMEHFNKSKGEDISKVDSFTKVTSNASPTGDEAITQSCSSSKDVVAGNDEDHKDDTIANPKLEQDKDINGPSKKSTKDDNVDADRRDQRPVKLDPDIDVDMEVESESNKNVVKPTSEGDLKEVNIPSKSKHSESLKNINDSDLVTAMEDSNTQKDAEETGKDLTSAVISQKESIPETFATANYQSAHRDDKHALPTPKDEGNAVSTLILSKSLNETEKDNTTNGKRIESSNCLLNPVVCLTNDFVYVQCKLGEMSSEDKVLTKLSKTADNLHSKASIDKHGAVATDKLESQEAIKGGGPPGNVESISIIPPNKIKLTKKSSAVTTSPKPKPTTPKTPRADASATAEGSKPGSNKLILNRRSAKGGKKVVQPEEVPEQKLSSKKRRREKNEDGRRRKKRNDETSVADNENWVQCERCLKWRLIPSVDNLPEKWYCELNEFDLERNTCDAPQQTQEEVAKLRKKQTKKTKTQSIKLKRPKSQSPMTVSKRSGNEPNSTGAKSENKNKPVRSNSPVEHKSLSELTTKSSDSGDEYVQSDENNQRSRGAGLRVSDEETRGGTNDGADGLSSATKMKSNKRNRQSRDDEGKPKKKGRKPKEAKQQEWVQCEKCDKWRRLPSHIKAKDLPDTWYCSMNTWDPRSASCAVQDDFKVDAVKPTNTSDIGGIMGGPQKRDGTKLSYRDLIRKPTRSITEKMRATESIFSSHAGEHEGEASGPPVVTYCNSSAFQQKVSWHRSNANNSSNEHVPLISEVSLFSLMSHSQLWKDLIKYQGDLSNNETERSSKLLQRGEMKDNQMHMHSTSSMKAMVHYALGRGLLTADEVLFECQCGDWKEMPWTDLRACCTIDSVTNAINELVKDGLVEEVYQQMNGNVNFLMDMALTKRYRHVTIEGLPSSLHAGLTSLTPFEQAIEEKDAKKSKFKKYSKPWKRRIQCQLE